MTGHRGAVPREVPLVVGEVGDARLVRQIVDEPRVDTCIHFAALSVVSESMARPRRYWVPRRPDLADMIRSAWRWRREHAGGYAEETDRVA